MLTLPGRKRRRVPLIQQMESVECGAACLAMVLGSHGRFVPLEELRDRCRTGRSGVSAADLAAAGAAYGLRVGGFSREPDQLKELALPQILFWDFEHFVVLEGWSPGRFHIADPVGGRRCFAAAEFGRHFTGVTLTLQPGPGFTRSRRPPGMMSHLLAEARQAKGALALVGACGFLMALLGTLIPGFTRVFVDDYLGQGRRDWLVPLLAAMVAATLLRTGLSWLQVRALQMLNAKMTLSITAQFIWRLFHLPLGFFLRRSAGEVSTRAQLTGQVAGVVSGPMVQVCTEAVSAGVFAAVMTLYSPFLTLLCLGFAVLNLLGLHWLNGTMREHSLRLDIAGAHAHAVGIQAMVMVEDYKATGTESLLFERMMDAELRHLDAEQRMGQARALAGLVPHLSSGLLAVLVLGAGTVQVMSSTMTIGTLVGFHLLSEMFGHAVGGIFNQAATVQAASGGVTRLRDTLDHPLDRTPPPPPEPDTLDGVARLAGGVSVSGVGFAYEHEAPVLHGIDLALQPGEFVAIIGPSGSGKTTLGRLLVGLAPPSSGELRLDGRLMQDIPESELRSSVAYVEQTPYLFAGKIRDNLSLWDGTVDAAMLAGAVRDAALGPVIARRPGAYDGRVGENGVGFSGGERQLLAVARALVRDPSLIVLDEATSALDANSELTLLDSLRRRGATCVLITHRSSVLRFCHRVIVMQQGRIVADGPAATVLAANGAFAGLVEAPA